MDDFKIPKLKQPLTRLPVQMHPLDNFDVNDPPNALWTPNHDLKAKRDDVPVKLPLPAGTSNGGYMESWVKCGMCGHQFKLKKLAKFKVSFIGHVSSCRHDRSKGAYKCMAGCPFTTTSHRMFEVHVSDHFKGN